jgi:hypothetical protein
MLYDDIPDDHQDIQECIDYFMKSRVKYFRKFRHLEYVDLLTIEFCCSFQEMRRLMDRDTMLDLVNNRYDYDQGQ